MRGRRMITEYNHLYERLRKLEMLREKVKDIDIFNWLEDEIIFVKNKMKVLEKKIRESNIEHDWTEALDRLNT